MKASEIRIGNWVRGYNLIFELESINDKWVTHPTELGRFFIDDLEPIQLTEEWLLKFGFEKADEIYFIEFGVYSMTIKEYEKAKYILNPETHFNYVDIEYVHQLQNLYFALTNEELTYEQQK